MVLGCGFARGANTFNTSPDGGFPTSAAADADAQENAVVREDAQEDNGEVVFMVFVQKEWEIGAIKG